MPGTRRVQSVQHGRGLPVVAAAHQGRHTAVPLRLPARRRRCSRSTEELGGGQFARRAAWLRQVIHAASQFSMVSMFFIFKSGKEVQVVLFVEYSLILRRQRVKISENKANFEDSFGIQI